jgi:hypothetical protein
MTVVSSSFGGSECFLLATILLALLLFFLKSLHSEGFGSCVSYLSFEIIEKSGRKMDRWSDGTDV